MNDTTQNNVFGEPIATCSNTPKTGFTRSGCCETGEQDVGLHTVCAVMTEAFLAFSRNRGNDLSTPVPEYEFPGLKPGGSGRGLCAPGVVTRHTRKDLGNHFTR